MRGNLKWQEEFVGYEKESNKQIQHKYDNLKIKLEKDQCFYQSQITHLENDVESYKDSIKNQKIQIDELA